MNYFAAMKKVVSENSDDYRAYFTDEELAETPAQRKVRLQAKKATPVPKGSCKRCGVHIGRGLWRHEQSCDGAA